MSKSGNQGKLFYIVDFFNTAKNSAELSDFYFLLILGRKKEYISDISNKYSKGNYHSFFSLNLRFRRIKIEVFFSLPNTLLSSPSNQ